MLLLRCVMMWVCGMLVGCPSAATVTLGAVCVTSVECSQAQLCREGRCAPVGCETDAECGEGYQCLPEFGCRAIASEPPMIDYVQGTALGGRVSTSGEIVIMGDHFGEAPSVQLSTDDAAAVYELELTEAHNTRLVTRLPNAMAYPQIGGLLRVSNSAGAAQETLTIEPGEAGPAGATGAAGAATVLTQQALQTLMDERYLAARTIGRRRIIAAQLRPWPLEATTWSFINESIVRANSTQASAMGAPMGLPDGATLQDVECLVADPTNGADRIAVEVAVIERSIAAPYLATRRTCATFTSTHTSPLMSSSSFSSCGAEDHRIDTDPTHGHVLHLFVRVVDSGGQDADDPSIYFRSCVVSYVTGIPAP